MKNSNESFYENQTFLDCYQKERFILFLDLTINSKKFYFLWVLKVWLRKETCQLLPYYVAQFSFKVNMAQSNNFTPFKKSRISKEK